MEVLTLDVDIPDPRCNVVARGFGFVDVAVRVSWLSSVLLFRRDASRVDIFRPIVYDAREIPQERDEKELCGLAGR